jgi:hypothetical protein
VLGQRFIRIVIEAIDAAEAEESVKTEQESDEVS